LDELTSTQLSEWEAYDKIDPIGTWRDDYRMAYLACTIVNIVKQLYAEKSEKLKLLAPMDFMPVWDAEKLKEIEEKPQDLNEMKNMLLSIATAQNKKVKRLNQLKKDKPPSNLVNKQKK
jgi:hypothetical protein